MNSLVCWFITIKTVTAGRDSHPNRTSWLLSRVKADVPLIKHIFFCREYVKYVQSVTAKMTLTPSKGRKLGLRRYVTYKRLCKCSGGLPRFKGFSVSCFNLASGNFRQRAQKTSHRFCQENQNQNPPRAEPILNRLPPHGFYIIL